MERGWSVRVFVPDRGGTRTIVKWYLVAETEPVAAVAALRRFLAMPDASAEAVQRVTPLFQGRLLGPGEVAYLFSRGTPKP